MPFDRLERPGGGRGHSETGSEHVERARAVAARLEAWTDQIEQERRIPPPVLDALFDAGLFRLLLPRSLDGAEVDPATFVQVIAAIARTDASAAWCLCQASGCSMVAAYLRPDVVDVWHVIGLRGTGSDTFTVTDLYVPHEHSVARDSEAERRRPGPLYCFPSGSLYASGFAGVALGIARTTLDAFVELARDKTARGARHQVRDNAVVQSQVAQSEVKLRAARLFLLTSLADIWTEVQRVGSLSLDHRMTIRLAATHAIHQAKEVVDTTYHAAGSSAIFAKAPFERRFRDIHAVTQQLQGRQAHFETVGQFLLGLPADTTFV